MQPRRRPDPIEDRRGWRTRSATETRAVLPCMLAVKKVHHHRMCWCRGGVTDTPVVGDLPNRDKMLRPALMAAAALAAVGRGAIRERQALHCRGMEYGPAAGASGRSGRRTGCPAQHCAYAYRASLKLDCV